MTSLVAGLGRRQLFTLQTAGCNLLLSGSLLGIKGEDYGSCAPSNFLTGDPTHALGVLYDPGRETLYVAWEDGLKLSGTE